MKLAAEPVCLPFYTYSRHLQWLLEHGVKEEEGLVFTNLKGL